MIRWYLFEQAFRSASKPVQAVTGTADIPCAKFSPEAIPSQHPTTRDRQSVPTGDRGVFEGDRAIKVADDKGAQGFFLALENYGFPLVRPMKA